MLIPTSFIMRAYYSAPSTIQDIPHYCRWSTKCKIEAHETMDAAMRRVEDVLQNGIWITWQDGTTWVPVVWAYYITQPDTIPEDVISLAATLGISSESIVIVAPSEDGEAVVV